MGEAKYRRMHDSFFGKVPKAERSTAGFTQNGPVDTVPKLGETERGLVISSPAQLNGDGSFSLYGGLDVGELRLDLLFWDKLVWPSNALIRTNNQEADYLASVGILSRPHYFHPGGTALEIMAETQAQGFMDLDQRDPGKWAIGQGRNSIQIPNNQLIDGRGVLVALQRAVPVPSESVALEDVLEFKARRRDDMLALREELDGFYDQVLSAEDKDFAMQRFTARIDRACVNLLRVAAERHIPVKMSDWSVSLNVNEAVVHAVRAWGMASVVGMPQLSAALLGGAVGLSSIIKVGVGVGLRGRQIQNSPYRYVVRIHNELV